MEREHLRTTGPNLVLIGHRATGKSAVARELARLLPQYPSLCERIPPMWMDTDQMIERACGRSIDRIFQTEGERSFRDRETELLRNLSTRRVGIVATGGGMPVRPENQCLLRRMGTIIWLTASAETIARRLAEDPNSRRNRPTLQVEREFTQIAENAWTQNNTQNNTSSNTQDNTPNDTQDNTPNDTLGTRDTQNVDPWRGGDRQEPSVEAIRFVLHQREPIYRELADETVCSEYAPPETIANQILRSL